MDVDGNNVKHLTNGVREWFPRISLDGKWVYYMQVNEDGPQTLCKVSIDGGEPTVLATMPAGIGRSDFIDVARDGRIVYERNRWLNDHRERTLYVISPNGGPPISELRLPLTAAAVGIFQWMPDSKSFVFNDTRDGQANLWTIPANGKGKEKRLTNFGPGIGARGFKWSGDGKQLLLARGTRTSDGVLITNAAR
jgi:Tol biopolymer transport system component